MLSLQKRLHDTNKVVDDATKCHVPNRMCRISSSNVHHTDSSICCSYENCNDDSISPKSTILLPIVDGPIQPERFGRYPNGTTDLRNDNNIIHNNTNNDTSLWIERLHSAWWWCTFIKTNTGGMCEMLLSHFCICCCCIPSFTQTRHFCANAITRLWNKIHYPPMSKSATV